MFWFYFFPYFLSWWYLILVIPLHLLLVSRIEIVHEKRNLVLRAVEAFVQRYHMFTETIEFLC